MIPNKNLGPGNTWGTWVQDEIQSLKNEIAELKNAKIQETTNKLVNLTDNAASKVSFATFNIEPLFIPALSENYLLMDKTFTFPDTNRNYMNVFIWGQGYYKINGHQDMWNSDSQLMLGIFWIESGQNGQKKKWVSIPQIPDMTSGQHSKNAFNSLLFWSGPFNRLDSIKFNILGNNKLTSQANPDKAKHEDEFDTWFNGGILMVESNQPLR